MKLLSFFSNTEYTVGYRICKDDILDNTTEEFRFLPHNDRAWYADPFVFVRDDEYYVFMEVLMKDKGYAGIGCSKLTDGVLSEPKVVIDYGRHLSFPFVFEYNGETYLVPESCSEKKLKLFHCIRFPDEWEEVYYISDERGFYDPVLFSVGGKSYLFASEPTQDIYGSRLYMFELESGTLTPEILSEKIISDDYKNSRNGGKIISKNGKFIRVAQDCSKKEYGRAVVFMEIDNISDYSEHQIRQIEPKDIRTTPHIKGKLGLHTYNRAQELDVIDIKYFVFDIKVIKYKIRFLFTEWRNLLKR